MLSLKGQAASALAEGNFDQVDRLLSKAEDNYQRVRTLEEVRKFAEIRITRGDNSLFRGDPGGALALYLSAAEFFRPFDESEMATCLSEMAGKAYEVARRTLDAGFFVASRLLETLIEIPSLQVNLRDMAIAKYQLGLIYRSEYEQSPRDGVGESLDKAISYARQSNFFFEQEGGSFESVSAAISLANCLWQRGKSGAVPNDIKEAVEIFEKANSNLSGLSNAAELVPHICNNLGGALLDLRELSAPEIASSLLDKALDAFNTGVKASEEFSNAEGWAAAKSNLGGLLAQKAQMDGSDESIRNFLRVRAIAELSAALEAWPSVAFPIPYAQTQLRLGDVLRVHAVSIGEPLAELYLHRALQAYEAATSVYSEERDPARWAHIQIQIGSIFAFHAKMEGVNTVRDDYMRAVDDYRKALPILRNSTDELAADWCAQALKRAEVALTTFQDEDD